MKIGQIVGELVQDFLILAVPPEMASCLKAEKGEFLRQSNSPFFDCSWPTWEQNEDMLRKGVFFNSDDFFR